MTIPTPPPTTLSTPSPTERSSPLDTNTDSHPDPMASRSRPIYLIVATTSLTSSLSSASASTSSPASTRLGIGFKNALPWPQIKADMGFFMRVTRDSRAPSAGSPRSPSMNAVIMGRKTYESIPARFRPLAGRLNVVVSRSEPREIVGEIEEEIKREKGKGDGAQVHFETCAVSTSDSGENVLLVQKGVMGGGVLEKRVEVAPVLVSSSVDAALGILTQASPSTEGSTSPLRSTSTSTPATTSTPSSAPSRNTTTTTTPLTSQLQSQISNIFIIGGAEVYASFLNTSSSSPAQPSTSNQSIGPIRILQTTIRKFNGGEFECDTFFPVALGSHTKAQDNESGWTNVPQETIKEWLVDGEGKEMPLPQTQDGQGGQGGENGEGGWVTDEKVGVELKVLGWEKM